MCHERCKSLIEENITKLNCSPNKLLKSICTKDKMYNTLVRTDVVAPLYITLQSELTNFTNTFCRSIN